MERLTATIIAICMVAIAGSFGAVIYRVAGISVGEAAMAAFALLLVFILLESRKVRDRDRKVMAGRLEDMDRFLGTLSREVQHLEHRFAALETGADNRIEDGLKAFSDEIESLAAGMGELSESISAIEEKLKRPPPAPGAPAAAAGEQAIAEPAPDEPDEEQEAAERARAICTAIEGERIDIFLQSVVTLPQRKVAFYEALSRLRGEDGRMMLPDEFLPVAAAEGLLPALDSHVLFRAVQVLRRLNARNSGLGMFCNIALESLADHDFFQEMAGFLEVNQELADSLILEFRQKTVRGMSPVEIEGLGALARLGYRFSIDNVRDLKTDFHDLADRGFRFVKIRADMLLRDWSSSGSDIHAADFVDLLSRYGMEMIVERIETETTVVDLLDFDVRYGQGNLFSIPRPVRADMVQSAEPARKAAAAR